MTSPDDMMLGVKYRVRYQIPGVHRIPREAVAKFIGMERGRFSENNDKFEFSGRPEYGSTDLERSQIISVEMVPSSTECYHSRKVRS